VRELLNILKSSYIQGQSAGSAAQLLLPMKFDVRITFDGE
jgi:hypothetical protein